MTRRLVTVWRGLGYGIAAGAAPCAILFLVAAVEAVFNGPGAIVWGLVFLGFGAAIGVIPGLAVGVTLAYSISPGDSPLHVHKGRVALISGAAFFVENALMAIITGGPFWGVLCVLGTPVAAALGAVGARRIASAAISSKAA